MFEENVGLTYIRLVIGENVFSNRIVKPIYDTISKFWRIECCCWWQIEARGGKEFCEEVW